MRHFLVRLKSVNNRRILNLYNAHLKSMQVTVGWRLLTTDPLEALVSQHRSMSVLVRMVNIIADLEFPFNDNPV